MFYNRKKHREYVSGMWDVIEREGPPPVKRMFYSGTRYKTVEYNGIKMEIPTDDYGYVLPEDMLRRLYGEDYLGRDPRRDKVRDSNRIIEIGYGITPEEIKEWWYDPSRLDLEGIDDRRHELIRTDYPVRDETREAHECIYITDKDRDPEDEFTIRYTLESSFSPDELKDIVSKGTVNVRFAKIPKDDEQNVGAFFNPARNDVTIIEGREIPEVITHEFVHALKYNSDRRRQPLTRSQIPFITDDLDKVERNRLRDVEESETCLETRPRRLMDRFDGETRSEAGISDAG